MTVFTAQLIEKLKDGKPGDVLTDTDLVRVSEKNCRCGGNGYGYLMSAVRHCVKHYGVVWQRLPRAGCIKCLNAEEIAALGESAPRRIQRACNRTLAKMKTADVTAMTESGRTGYNLSLAQLGFIAHLSGSGGRKRLEARKISGPLYFSKMLDNMSKQDMA